MWDEWDRYGLKSFHQQEVKSTVKQSVDREHSLLAADILVNSMCDVDGLVCGPTSAKAIVSTARYLKAWWKQGSVGTSRNTRWESGWHPTLWIAAQKAAKEFALSCQGAVQLKGLLEGHVQESTLTNKNTEELREVLAREVEKYLIKMQKTWVELAFAIWFDGKGPLAFRKHTLTNTEASAFAHRLPFIKKALGWLCKGCGQPWHVASNIAKTEEGKTFVHKATEMFGMSPVAENVNPNELIELLWREKRGIDNHSGGVYQYTEGLLQSWTCWGLHPQLFGEGKWDEAIELNRGIVDVFGIELNSFAKVPENAHFKVSEEGFSRLQRLRQDSALMSKPKVKIDDDNEMRRKFGSMGKLVLNQLLKWFVALDIPADTKFPDMKMSSNDPTSDLPSTLEQSRNRLMYGRIGRTDREHQVLDKDCSNPENNDSEHLPCVLSVPSTTIPYRSYTRAVEKLTQKEQLPWVLTKNSLEYDSSDNLTESAAEWYCKAWTARAKQDPVQWMKGGVWIHSILQHEVHNQGLVPAHFDLYVTQHAKWASPAVNFLKDALFVGDSNRESMLNLDNCLTQVDKLCHMADGHPLQSLASSGEPTLRSLFNPQSVVNAMESFLNDFYYVNQEVFLRDEDENVLLSGNSVTICELSGKWPHKMATLTGLPEAITKRIQQDQTDINPNVFNTKDLLVCGKDWVKNFSLKTKKLHKDHYDQLLSALKDNVDLFNEILIKELQMAFGNRQDALALEAFGQNVGFGRLLWDAQKRLQSFRPDTYFSENSTCPYCPGACPSADATEPWNCHKLKAGIVWATERFSIKPSFAFDSDDDEDFDLN